MTVYLSDRDTNWEKQRANAQREAGLQHGVKVKQDAPESFLVNLRGPKVVQDSV